MEALPTVERPPHQREGFHWKRNLVNYRVGGIGLTSFPQMEEKRGPLPPLKKRIQLCLSDYSEKVTKHSTELLGYLEDALLRSVNVGHQAAVSLHEGVRSFRPRNELHQIPAGVEKNPDYTMFTLNSSLN